MRTTTRCLMMAAAMAWAGEALAISATGGNVTNDVDGYRTHIFTNSATAGSLVVSESGNLDVLVVAGGGGGSAGGGNGSGAGGGAGGLIYSSSVAVAAGTIPVTVGGGGKGGDTVVTTDRSGGNGTNSVFGSLTAFGGGGAGSYNNISGKNGGSGGGGSYYYPGAGSGTNGQGYAGGLGYGLYSGTTERGGGGGGGAGTAGTNWFGNNGGRGGAGRSLSLSGSAQWYAGGGGGGGAVAGVGGTGGGGSGGISTSINGTKGTPFTGGGGGGAYDGIGIGGAGGAGIVIVRYLLTLPLQVIATNATAIGPTGATLNGKLVGDGSDPTTTVTFCWGYTDGGTSATSGWDKATVLGSTYSQGQTFSLPLIGLLSGSTYVYRCYATNTTGSDWADDVKSVTTIRLPAVTNLGASGTTTVSAWLTGQVTDTGGESPQARFDYWADGSSTTSSVPMGAQDGVFSNRVTGLDPGTLYHVRVAAVNAAGEAVSSVENVQTPAAAFWYVAPVGSGEGTNWATAFTNLQQAVNLCTNAGDTIYVRYGTYTNAVEISLNARPGIRIRGGYAGTSPEPGDKTNAPTILTRDPAINARLLNGNASTVLLDTLILSGGRINENGAGLRFTNGCQVTLQDCTIRNNAIPASPARYGAGLYITNGTLTATGCRFDSNSMTFASWDAYEYGGGAACVSVTSTFVSCSFNGNTMSEQHYDVFGGGLYLSGGGATIRQSTFSGNWVQMGAGASVPKLFGGALYAAGGVSPLTVDGCRFAGNTLVPAAGAGTKRGSAVCVTGAGTEAQFLSCDWSGNGSDLTSEDFWTDATRPILISNNVFRGSGYGAIYKEGAGSLSVVQCLVRRNTGHALRAAAGPLQVLHSTLADNTGWGLTNAAAAVTVRDSIVWGNTAGGISTSGVAVTYTCSQNPLAGTGTITNDPCFAFGYYLSDTNQPMQAVKSPCIDAGSGAAADLGYATRTTRADGQADSGAVDMGCHFTNGLSSFSNAFLYVDAAAGSDGNTGWSPDQALKTVSAALDRVVPAGTIDIASGIYSNGGGGERFPLALDIPSLTVKGAGPAATILDARSTARLLAASGGSLVFSGITFRNGLTVSDNGGGLYFWNCRTVLTNCHFMNNRMNKTNVGLKCGGGIFNGGGSLTVIGCEFRTNSIYWNGSDYTEYVWGGALYSINAAVTIANSLFQGNFASTKHYDCFGGGVALSGGQAVIVGTTFTSNYLYTSGGSSYPNGAALYAYNVAPLTVESSTFMTNFGEANSLGGTFYMGGSVQARILSTVFYRNGSGTRRGDVYLAGGTLAMTNGLVAQTSAGDGVKIAAGTARLINCTFAGNTAYGVNNVAGVATAQNCIAWGNTTRGLTNCPASYCDSQEALAGTGNKSVDPLFVDTTYYHLKSKAGHYANGWFSGGTWAKSSLVSPLIDAGDPASPYDREPDPRGHFINLGAYGNTDVASRSGMPGTMVVIY